MDMAPGRVFSIWRWNSAVTRQCNDNIRKIFELVDRMIEIADAGDAQREDSGCGILYGVVRDSAFKIRQLAVKEREAHIRKGWWREEG
jgi:hypothetical protein